MRASALFAICLLGCGSARDYDGLSEPIVNGTVETGAPWVVMVVQQAEGSTKVRLCTGTVVGPREVLTAKHCVYQSTGAAEWAAVPIADLTIRTGADFRATERTIEVAEVLTTEGPYVTDSGRTGGDIAVVRTAEDLDIAPRPVSRAAPAAAAAVELHGYGYTQAGATSASDLGIKHVGVAQVDTVEPLVFSTSGATWSCTGDSGGPVIDQASGNVLGVTSIGPAGCRVSTSYATRVDAYLDLLDRALGVVPDAGPAPESDGGAPAGSPGDGATGPSCSCGAAGAGTIWMLVGLLFRPARQVRRRAVRPAVAAVR